MSLGDMGCMSSGQLATVSKQFPNKDVYKFSQTEINLYLEFNRLNYILF